VPVNYVLIDMENVQPDGLQTLVGLAVKVMVFVGENQTRIPLEFAAAMQELGRDATYIRMSGNGPNALDFHIAYYVGKLAVSDPTAYFHIISKDTGFDPLIKHLRTNHTPKIRVYRLDDILKIPIVRAQCVTSPEERLSLVVANFERRCKSLPKKEENLIKTVKAVFAGKLPDSEVSQILQIMKSRSLVRVENGTVHYSLNGASAAICVRPEGTGQTGGSLRFKV